MMMCNNCRTVTLLSKMYKILGNILYLKLVPYAEECQNTKEVSEEEDQLLIKFLV